MKWSFNKVLSALNNIKNYSAYYVGATLFIDFDFHPNVALNKNGRGFFYWKENGKVREIKFVMTNEMKKIVNNLYESKLNNG